MSKGSRQHTVDRSQGKRKWILFSPIFCLLFTVYYLTFTSQAEHPKATKRDVFLEALTKIKRGLSDSGLKGEEYYKHYCNICHGEEGRGDGFNAYNLDPKPRNFTEIIPSMDDQYLYKVISEGTASVGKSALCPPRGLYLERGTIEAIIEYLRKLNDQRKEKG